MAVAESPDNDSEWIESEVSDKPRSISQLASLLGMSRLQIGHIVKPLAHQPGRQGAKLYRPSEVIALLPNKDVPSDLRSELVREQIRKLKLQNDKAAKLVRTVEAINSAHAEIATAVKSLLKQKLEVEFPTELAGMDVADIRVAGKKLGDSILREFQRLATLLPEEEE